MDQQNMFKLLLDIKSLVQDKQGTPRVSDKWLPRAAVMDFFGYGDTQMIAFERQHRITTAKVGKRKFYSRESIADVLDRQSSHEN